MRASNYVIRRQESETGGEVNISLIILCIGASDDKHMCVSK